MIAGNVKRSNGKDEVSESEENVDTFDPEGIISPLKERPATTDGGVPLRRSRRIEQQVLFAVIVCGVLSV